MANSSSLYDYKIFLKKNSKIIISTTIVLLLVLLTAVGFFVTRQEEVVIDDDYVTEQILPQIESTRDVEELSSSDQELLTDYLNKRSRSFRIYVENEDDSVFTDNVLLRQILLDDQLVQTISSETNSEFIPTRELAVSVFTISGSEIIQVKVGTGNEEYNQRIANYYYEYIENGNISLFNNKSIYFLDSEPISFEEIYGPTEDQEPEEEISFKQQITSNLEMIIIVVLLGILGGLILGMFIGIIKENLNKKIPSIYNFELYDRCTIVNLDAILINENNNRSKIITQAIVAENQKNKLVLSEKPQASYFSDQLEEIISRSNTKYYLNVNNIEDIQLDDIEEVIILVQLYETSKKWFEKQMEQTKALNTPIKIIRVPLDSDFYKED